MIHTRAQAEAQAIIRNCSKLISKVGTWSIFFLGKEADQLGLVKDIGSSV